MWKPRRAAWKGLGVLRSWGRGLGPEEEPAGMLPDSLLPFEGVSCPPQSCMDGRGYGCPKGTFTFLFWGKEQLRQEGCMARPSHPRIRDHRSNAWPLSGAAPGKEACGSWGGQRSEGGQAAGRGQELSCGPEKEGLQCEGTQSKSMGRRCWFSLGRAHFAGPGGAWGPQGEGRGPAKVS